MRTFRSPAKLFGFGIAGLILIAAAIDVMFLHWLSEPPEATAGVLSTRGQAQLRGDLLWGGTMVAAGTLLVLGSVVELVRRRPQAEVTNHALVLAVGSHEHEVVIPWDDIVSVSSESAEDPYDGSARRYLLVELTDRSVAPEDPIGATWDGNLLRVDADDWTKRVTDVALAAQGALAHHRRVEGLKGDFEQPSLVWDIDVSDLPAEPSAELKSSAVVLDTDSSVDPDPGFETPLEEAPAHGSEDSGAHGDDDVPGDGDDEEEDT